MSTNAMAVSLQLETELAAWPELNPENVHPYRLKVKELRNILRLAQGDDTEFIDTLAEVKDKIGEWHDWNELAAVADKVLDHGAACAITKQIKLKTKEELEEALSVANTMRRHYLQGNLPRGSARKRSPVRLKPSVVMATSRLAG
jgi:CHAD domain-containing protein